MAYESIAHEADSEPIRARGIIVKYTDMGFVLAYSHVRPLLVRILLDME